MHNSRIFDHTFELLLPEVRHDVGVDANALSLVDETEVLEALALELLSVVAFLAERFVAMAESIVDGQSKLRGTFDALCFVLLCVSLLLVLVYPRFHNRS